MPYDKVQDLEGYRYHKESVSLLEMIWEVFKLLLGYPLMVGSWLTMVAFWMTWWWMYPLWGNFPPSSIMLLIYIAGFGSAPLWKFSEIWFGEMRDIKLVLGLFVLSIYGSCAYQLGLLRWMSLPW